MAHLIDKDALVAEIEKLKEIYSKCLTHHNYEDGLKEGRLIGYEDALHKINIFEVKEVDLEKELNKLDSTDDNTDSSETRYFITVEDVKDIAKYFFELGLKAQKEK